MTDTIRIPDHLDTAAQTKGGVNYTFVTKGDMASWNHRLRKRITREHDKLVEDHITLMERGVIDATVPWPKTGWEDLEIRMFPKENRLWIGHLTREKAGILEIVKGFWK